MYASQFQPLHPFYSRARTGEALGEADQQPAGGLNYVSVNPTIEDIRKPNTHAHGLRYLLLYKYS